MTLPVTHVPEHPLPISPVYTVDSGRGELLRNVISQPAYVLPRPSPKLSGRATRPASEGFLPFALAGAAG